MSEKLPSDASVQEIHELFRRKHNMWKENIMMGVKATGVMTAAYILKHAFMGAFNNSQDSVYYDFALFAINALTPAYIAVRTTKNVQMVIENAEIEEKIEKLTNE